MMWFRIVEDIGFFLLGFLTCYLVVSYLWYRKMVLTGQIKPQTKGTKKNAS